MNTHLVESPEGLTFQSDKYPTTPAGKVPLSVRDPTAQDLLWTYAQRRRKVDADFAEAVEIALKVAGYVPTPMGFMLTDEQLAAALKNIGYDVTCGACAEVFFTGMTIHEHDDTCTTPRVGGPVTMTVAASVVATPMLDADRWGWALSEAAEFWQGASSRQEAIDSARAQAGSGKDVWIQSGVTADAADSLPDPDQFIENMEQNAADSGCPDEIDEPFTFADGADEALQELLAAWAKKYVKTTNWWVPVGKPERVPAEST